MKDFKNKKCLITGAASGIGRSMAISMGLLEADLFLTDINQQGLEETVQIIKENGGTVSMYKAFDIADYDQVKQFANEVHSKFGAMEIIMNIAGISTWGGVEILEHQHWAKMINVDLWGPIHIMETFLKKTIQEGKEGHLVNVSSAAGLFGLPWHSPYSAAKAGLVGISEVLRFDLERQNIGVTLVCPGAVETPLKQTVEIVGVDRSSPEAKEIEKKFSDKTVSPDHVADLIIKAIINKKYLVFTSFDMKALWWFKRKLAPLYRLVMRRLQRLVTKARNFSMK